MPDNGNVFLIGPMGAGKSTIGRLLARELGLDYYDSDQEIEKRTGAPIALIFDVEGEPGFRKREVAIIRELTALNGILLSTGGGAVCDPRNRKNLASRGTVVYLRASVEQQLERTRFDRTRPLLQQDNVEEVLQRLIAERDPYYQEIADVIVETDSRKARAVANDIARILQGTA